MLGHSKLRVSNGEEGAQMTITKNLVIFILLPIFFLVLLFILGVPWFILLALLIITSLFEYKLLSLAVSHKHRKEAMLLITKSNFGWNAYTAQDYLANSGFLTVDNNSIYWTPAAESPFVTDAPLIIDRSAVASIRVSPYVSELYTKRCREINIYLKNGEQFRYIPVYQKRQNVVGEKLVINGLQRCGWQVDIGHDPEYSDLDPDENA